MRYSIIYNEEGDTVVAHQENLWVSSHDIKMVDGEGDDIDDLMKYEFAKLYVEINKDKYENNHDNIRCTRSST